VVANAREAGFAARAAAAAADVAGRRAERLRRTRDLTHTVGSLALTRTCTAEIPSGSSGTHKADRAVPHSAQPARPRGTMLGRGSLGVHAERCSGEPWPGSVFRAVWADAGAVAIRASQNVATYPTPCPDQSRGRALTVNLRYDASACLPMARGDDMMSCGHRG
jgi:hypothetical protein